MGKAPAFQFYVRDWLIDPQLRMATHTAKGVWIDCLCYMWEAPARGELTGTREDLSRVLNLHDSYTLDDFIREIEGCGFADIDITNDELTIKSRRFVREEKVRADNRNRQRKYAAKGGGNPERWNAIRVAILQRDDYICAYCGKKARTVDHIKPKSKGGDERSTNLVACCYGCNLHKSSRTPEEADMSFWHGFDSQKLTKTNDELTPPSSTASSTSTSKGTKSTLVNGVDPQRVVDLWNEVMAGLEKIPQVRTLTEPRRKAIRARCSEDKTRDLSWWRELFDRIAASDFLTGRKGDWHCSFDWVLKPANLTKILEGNYDCKAGGLPEQPQFTDSDEVYGPREG